MAQHSGCPDRDCIHDLDTGQVLTVQRAEQPAEIRAIQVRQKSVILISQYCNDVPTEVSAYTS